MNKTKRYPIIVRREPEGNLIAFFPGAMCSYGSITCMTFEGGHSEASIEYYHQTKKVSEELEKGFLLKYQNYSDSLPGDKEEFFLQHRLSYKATKEAWAWRFRA